MTTHIEVLSPNDVSPHEAKVWRDDQELIWLLAPGLQWGTSEPIRFDEGWPGSLAVPVGPSPDPGEPDTRPYVASLAGQALALEDDP